MSELQTVEGLISGEYRGVRRLKIAKGLSEFPPEILDLYESLEILDLSGNSLSRLPEDITRLHKLKIAFFSDCQFTVFPQQLSKCRSLEMVAFKGNGMTLIPEGSFPRKLRWLILTNNKITKLPRTIGHCSRLQKCMLAGNQLISIPDEMAHCRKLGLLRLSCNKLTSIPSFIFTLPELSFLSFAGNPCTTSPASNSTLTTIPWSHLTSEHLLGEGASGIISKGTLQEEPFPKVVAIKLFKGEVTSDGSPMDEMNACIAAGQHPNLTDPIGRIDGHPEKRGLVLQLIPPIYKNLGLPPTLESCTRDAFAPDFRITIKNVGNILLGIASASQHIHAKGIAHGDLYAHNILIDDAGHALLGDFGAATIYGRHFDLRQAVERLEVLAFGHLIEDLLALVVSSNDGVIGLKCKDEAEAIEKLNLLYWRCSTPLVLDRPSFEEIFEELGSL